MSSIDNAKLTNSSITITGDGGKTSDIDLGDTLTIEGGTGITTSVSADKVSISIDGVFVELKILVMYLLTKQFQVLQIHYQY